MAAEDARRAAEASASEAAAARSSAAGEVAAWQAKMAERKKVGCQGQRHQAYLHCPEASWVSGGSMRPHGLPSGACRAACSLGGASLACGYPGVPATRSTTSAPHAPTHRPRRVGARGCGGGAQGSAGCGIPGPERHGVPGGASAWLDGIERDGEAGRGPGGGGGRGLAGGPGLQGAWLQRAGCRVVEGYPPTPVVGVEARERLTTRTRAYTARRSHRQTGSAPGRAGGRAAGKRHTCTVRAAHAGATH